MSTKIRVKEKKLGRERAYGQAHIGKGKVDIDPRLKPKMELKIMIHEALHIIHPDWTEKQVIKTANALHKFLWQNNYRKVKG